MKKQLSILFTVILAFINTINSQNLLGIYEFNSISTCPNENPGVTTQPQFGIFSPFEGSNVSCSAAANVYNNYNWNHDSIIDLSEYISFTLTPTDCYRVNLDSLVFSYKNSAGGVNPTWHLRTNLDNYISDIASGISSSPTNILTTAIPLTNSMYNSLMNITFRFYITNMAGTTASTFRVDDVKLYGDITLFGQVNFYLDNDNDGFGAGGPTLLCSNPGGYSLLNTDCNDSDSLINPTTVWYQDNDSDGFGDTNTIYIGCIPTGIINPILVAGDCSDIASDLNPNTIWYEDADQDFFGNDNISQTGCTHTFSFATNINGDCMDSEPTVFPGAPELCDLFDNNCDGDVNEDLTFVTYYIDNDGDTYGAGSAGEFCDNPGIGYTLDNTDCNDDESAINSSAIDISDDGIDQNCDGVDGYLALNETANLNFSIFPNPGNDLISILFADNIEFEVALNDGNGKTLFEAKSVNSNLTIEASKFDKGVYFITIKSENKAKVVKWIKI
jgi:hypothetical protein